MISFLRERDVIRDAPVAVLIACEQLMERFGRFVVTERGLAADTIVNHRHAARPVARAVASTLPAAEYSEATKEVQMGPTARVEITIDEDEEHTDAEATIRVRDRDFTGRGRARRNPQDPNVPVIGEELATARALADLSHQLIVAAADEIEGFVGHRVSIEG